MHSFVQAKKEVATTPAAAQCVTTGPQSDTRTNADPLTQMMNKSPRASAQTRLCQSLSQKKDKPAQRAPIVQPPTTDLADEDQVMMAKADPAAEEMPAQLMSIAGTHIYPTGRNGKELFEKVKYAMLNDGLSRTEAPRSLRKSPNKM